MSVKVINGQAIPNMPWQDKPADCNEVIWRDNRNPIIPRNLLPTSNSIFNSAVVPFEGKFAGVFRVDDKERNMALHAGFSEDGIHWNINPTRIMFEQAEKSTEEVNQWGYGYDPRVCFIEDRYWVTWCNAYGWKPTIGVGYTYDFKKDQVGIEIHSGKNRIVRRIFESLGYKVVKLDRVFFAGLTKKGLRRGDWRYLSEAEVNYLRMGSFE